MKQIIILPTLLTLLLLTSCGGQKEMVKKYYLIEESETEIEAEDDTQAAIDAWCEVSEVEVYPAFSSRRIVLRDDSHQIRYFGEHEWAVRPSEVLTPIVMDYFAAHKIFTRVSDRFWEKAPDYRLNTTIFNIEVDNTGNKKDFEAHLKLRFELIDTQTDTIAVLHTADRKSNLEDRDLNLLAATISEIFHEELENFASRTKEILSKRKK
ncbi:MAG: ABC-type transport auxiliary lipoprotein family protein [Marinilabilia sp.]